MNVFRYWSIVDGCDDGLAFWAGELKLVKEQHHPTCLATRYDPAQATAVLGDIERGAREARFENTAERVLKNTAADRRLKRVVMRRKSGRARLAAESQREAQARSIDLVIGGRCTKSPQNNSESHGQGCRRPRVGMNMPANGTRDSAPALRSGSCVAGEDRQGSFTANKGICTFRNPFWKLADIKLNLAEFTRMRATRRENRHCFRSSLKSEA